MDWTVKYIKKVHGKSVAKQILADIDHRCVYYPIIRVCIICLHKNGPRIAAVPLFPGLRRFPEGRGFKQWTGDDSKALMKVMSTYCQFRDRDAEHITRYIYQP